MKRERIYHKISSKEGGPDVLIETITDDQGKLREVRTHTGDTAANKARLEVVEPLPDDWFDTLAL